MSSQQPNPQPMHSQSPYLQLPAPSAGIAIAAMILCTASSLSLVWSAVSFLVGLAPIESPAKAPGVILLSNGVWTIGDILLIIATILMWGRAPVGRILAIIGLIMVLISMVSLELVALSTPHDSIVRPWTYAINALTVLSLAFVLLPDTGRYLKARYSSPYQVHSQQSPHTNQPYDIPGSPVGGPPQQRKSPWIIGAITAVVVVVGCVAVFSFLPGENDNPGGDDNRAHSITYEISGTAPNPLSVQYAGSDGHDVKLTVTSLPWSVTVTPAPRFVSIFAVAMGADVTLTLKRGNEVIRKCHGGGPCLMPFPSGDEK